MSQLVRRLICRLTGLVRASRTAARLDEEIQVHLDLLAEENIARGMAAAVGSLALGIGANAAIFSLISALLLRPLPARDPSQLATFTAACCASHLGLVSASPQRTVRCRS